MKGIDLVEEDYFLIVKNTPTKRAQALRYMVKFIVKRIAIYQLFDRFERLIQDLLITWAQGIAKWQNGENIEKKKFLTELATKFKDSKLERYTFRWFNNRSMLLLTEGIQALVSVQLKPENHDATIRVPRVIQYYREDYHM